MDADPKHINNAVSSTLLRRETYVCDLTDASGPASCSVRKPAAEDYPDILTDMHVFEISLCHKQPGEAGTCEVLNKDFRPVYNSKGHIGHTLPL